jgi:hypothetical protein
LPPATSTADSDRSTARRSAPFIANINVSRRVPTVARAKR